MKHVLATLSATVGLVLVTALPAHAETRELADDNRATPARADITALKVTNGEKRVIAVVSLRRAVRGKTKLGVMIGIRSVPTYGAWTMPRKGGQKKSLFRFDGDTGAERLTCRGLRIRIVEKRDVVRFSVPHRCLGDSAPALRFSALSETRNGGDVEMTRSLRVARG